MWIYIYCFILVGLTGCMPSEKATSAKPLVINVLDKELYDDCHIIESVHVPFNRVEQYVHNENKDREIIVYCSNYACTTSHYVAQKLCELGFSHVYVYAGGMAEWWQYRLPVEGPATKPYLAVKMAPMPQSDEEITEEHGCNGVKIISTHELAEKLGVVVLPIENDMAA
jgi:rhodanese-related sulfurtransferase